MPRIAFGLVIAGAALIPAPLRVADPEDKPAEAAGTAMGSSE
jgi:hypothetical protein